MPIKIQIKKPEREVQDVSKLIEAFLEKNSLNTNLTIVLDYSLSDCGIYYYWESTKSGKRHNPHRLHINPNECQYSHVRTASSYGYTEDFTLAGVILHEFSHYIDNRLLLHDDFKSELIINPNCKKDTKERLAELLRLYLSNPYLLYLISEETFSWFKNLMHNPTPCSKEKFLSVYSNWTPKVRRECKKKWKIWVKNNEVFQN